MPLDSMTAPAHPILGFCELLENGLAAVAEVDPLFMTTEQKAEALVRLHRDRDRLAELELRVLRASDDVALEHGARSAAAWLAHETNTPTPVLVGEERLATALSRHALLGEALCDGVVNLAQARVAVAALDALPDSLADDLKERAEQVMVGYCADFRPKELQRLGSRLLDVLAPEVADAEEERRLRADEARARAATRLEFTPTGDGVTRISATVPDSVAAIFKAQLYAYTSPRRAHLDPSDPETLASEDPATGGRLPQAQLLGQAFCSLIEHVPVDRLPVHGNTAVSVVATIELDRLTSGLGGGILSTGQGLSAGETRRLACQSGLVPAVLGSKSEVLDLGRRQRLFNGPQRKALEIRDQRCRTEGCDTPAAWAEAHHLDPWSQGGRTDLADGVLLCSRHHHLIHDTTGYEHQWLPNGNVRFHRRT